MIRRSSDWNLGIRAGFEQATGWHAVRNLAASRHVAAPLRHARPDFLAAALTDNRLSEASPLRLSSNLILATSSASNFMILDRSIESVDSLASLRYRSIFSRLMNLSTAASYGHRTFNRLRLLEVAASSMSGTGHFTRLRFT
jgi:hypothetical protein